MKSSAKQESGIEQVTTMGTNHSEVGGLITPRVLPQAGLMAHLLKTGELVDTSGTRQNQVDPDDIQMKAR